MTGEVDDQVRKFIELRKEIDTKVKNNVTAAQARQKLHYDARHQQGSYKVGELVLLKNMKKLSKKGDKMAPNWFGPYEIAECVGKTNYRLKRKGKILKLLFCSTRLKDFNERGMCV